MNNQLLLNPIQDRELQELGYIKIPFLNAAEVEELQELFYNNTDVSTIGKGLYSNLYALSGKQNWQISLEMERICTRAFNANFTHASLNAGVFIAKGAVEETQCNLHQDYTNTDESTGATYALWIPLCDITPTTGLFNVIPGSHRHRSHVRAITNSSFYLNLDEINSDKLRKLSVKAGEAVIFDHALIHGSEANTSSQIRIAAVMGILPEGTDYRYYLKTGDSSFSIYKMDKEFYIRQFKDKISTGSIPRDRFIQTIQAEVAMEQAVVDSFMK